MTIPMLSGWADSLKDLPTLGNNLAHILNPNMDVQQRLKAAIAENPEIAQHLANLEAQNPGIIGKMFGTNNTGINSVAGMSPDINTQVNMSMQKDLPNLLNDQQNRGDIAERMLGIKSPEARQLEQQRLAIGKNEVTSSGQQVELNQAAIQDKNDALQRERLAKAAMSRVKFNPATFDKDYTPEEQAAVLGSKAFGSNISRRLELYSRQQEQRLMYQMRQEDRADARQAATDNFIRNRNLVFGQQLFQKSDGAITPADAVTLSDPAGQAQAAKLASDPNNHSTLADGYRWLQSQRQEALDNISNKNERLSQKRTELQLHVTDAVNKALNTANDMLQPGKYKKPADPALVNQVLQSASQAAGLMGRNITYQYVPEDTGNGFNPFDNTPAKIVAVDHDNGGRTYDASQNGVALAITPPVPVKAPPPPPVQAESTKTKTLSPQAKTVLDAFKAGSVTAKDIRSSKAWSQLAPELEGMIPNG